MNVKHMNHELARCPSASIGHGRPVHVRALREQSRRPNNVQHRSTTYIDTSISTQNTCHHSNVNNCCKVNAAWSKDCAVVEPCMATGVYIMKPVSRNASG